MGTSVLRVTTRCTDEDDFVRAFARQIDKDSLVVRAQNPAAVGVKPAFAIALADGSFVMRGRCDVVPQPRGMIKLRFISLDDRGQAVRDRILGREPDPSPRHEPLLTVRMAPLFPDEPVADDGDNPLEQLAPVELDVFVDMMLSEANAPVLVDAGPRVFDATASVPAVTEVAAAPVVPPPPPVEVEATAVSGSTGAHVAHRADTMRPDLAVVAAVAPPPGVAEPAAATLRVAIDEPTRPVRMRPARAVSAWRDDDRARIYVLAGGAALALVLAIAGGLGDHATAAAAPATAAAPVPASAAAPVPAAAAVPAPAAAAEEEEEIDLAPELFTPTCRLMVDARPAGATVHLDDLDLGAAPVDAAVPCGRAILTIAAPGYRTVHKPISLRPTKASVRLQ